MSKILGIDYGEVRIGIAISDETHTFARELSIFSPKDFWKEIQNLVHSEEVTKVIVGWPLNMEGFETQKTHEVGEFKTKLEDLLNIEVEVMDERLSSQMAQHLPGGKKNIDSLAAQILLQNYLDKNKN